MGDLGNSKHGQSSCGHSAVPSSFSPVTTVHLKVDTRSSSWKKSISWKKKKKSQWCRSSWPDASELEVLFLFVFFQMKVYLKQHRALVEYNETRVAACLKRQFQLPQFWVKALIRRHPGVRPEVAGLPVQMHDSKIAAIKCNSEEKG